MHKPKESHFWCMHKPEEFLTLSTIALSVYAYTKRVTFSVYACTKSAISKSIFAANSNFYAKRYFFRETGPQKCSMHHFNFLKNL